MSILIPPYGGRLVDLMVPPETLDDLKTRANRLPSLQLSERSVCDLELLATGAFSPLDRFMGHKDHRRVVEEMRLDNGYIFPIPITLPVDPGADIHLDQQVALRDARNDLLAIMSVEEIYEWDRDEVAQRVFGEQSFLILSVIALFSTFNTALMMLLTGSRLIYGIAQQEAIPKVFTVVGKRFRTPGLPSSPLSLRPYSSYFLEI